jgi:ubiquinone/menaquinone biosynthesis C-methylase UbiE
MQRELSPLVSNTTSKHDPAIDREAINLLRGGFDYYIGYEHGAVAPGYFWFRKRLRVLDLITRHVSGIVPSSAKPWRGIEVGCGDGVDFFLIHKKLSALAPDADLRFLGVDGNPDALKLCQLKKQYYGVRDAAFLRCDLSKPTLPCADGLFDFAFSSEVLEHIQRPEILLAELKRIIKPRGYFLITTPNEPNIFQRSYWNRARREAIHRESLAHPDEIQNENGEPLSIFGHVSVRTIAQWETALFKLGFERVDFERGALSYNPPGLLGGTLATGIRFCFEALLDALPKSWVRSLSDQMIGLYRNRIAAES